MNKDNHKKDLKIENILKIFPIIGMIGVIIIISVLLSGLPKSNPLFSIGLSLGLALLFISTVVYIATWLMEINLAYSRKQYSLMAILIIVGILSVLFEIIINR
ncbi:hypothetical protein ACQV2X_07485 [Facklamia sp. P12945]|uniref:hypothetical protein n=1 Tax=unclassified Facklamia TaxID=2622293 RepID=UPI003D17948F